MICKRAWKDVKELGDNIGYGELMTLASIVWASKLIDEGLPDNGACYATCIVNMKDSDITKREVEYRRSWVDFYRTNILNKER